MAGVEHAYQYSVEVKSRFSLFLDDNLNSEDPDLLILKLQQEKTKKDKVAPKAEAKSEPVRDAKPKEVPAKVEVKQESAPPPPVVQVSDVASVEPDPPVPIHSAPRGRGDAQMRGFRGRGRGSYPHNAADATGDYQNYGAPPEHRGRGRGRGRFMRGRGYAYTDYREFHNQDRGQPRAGFQGDAHGPDHNEPEEQEPNVDAGERVEPPAEGASDSPAKTEGAEEEPKTYTLEEYKAMRLSSRPIVTLATKGTRKANDGKDVFKDMVEHRKVVDNKENKENDIEHVGKEPAPEDKYEINVTFTDRLNEREKPNRGFSGRGFGRGRGTSGFRGRGRGGPGPRAGFRGERGRGFGRGMHSDHLAAPVIYSDQDFPSLK